MIAPENLTVANTYLEFSSIETTSVQLGIPAQEISTILNKAEVKRYIDNIYLDTGYRNRFKLANLLDEQIEAKLIEMQENEVSTKKDIVELIALAHKMRQDEIKNETERLKVSVGPARTNINITGFGDGNYGELMKELLIEGEAEECP